MIRAEVLRPRRNLASGQRQYEDKREEPQRAAHVRPPISRKPYRRLPLAGRLSPQQPLGIGYFPKQTKERLMLRAVAFREEVPNIRQR
jgi:hypothetical protein